MTAGFLGGRPEIKGAWRPSARQSVGVVGVVMGAVSFATDGHTVSQGPVVLNMALDVTHVLAAGVWAGGIAGLAIMTLRERRGAETAPLAPTAVRFSTVATLAIVSVAAAGLGMSFLIVDSPSDYVMTTWGRLLLLKVGLVLLAGSLGAYNHFVVVPALDTDPSDGAMLDRAKATVVVEAGLMIAVALVTVFLTGASINE
jgi:copper transport protein